MSELCLKFTPMLGGKIRPEKTLLRIHPNGLTQMETLSPEERYALSQTVFPGGAMDQLLAVTLSIVGELRAEVNRLKIEMEELRRTK
jgi:hypothetical protein